MFGFKSSMRSAAQWGNLGISNSVLEYFPVASEKTGVHLFPSPGSQEQLTNNLTGANQPSAGNHHTSLPCLQEIRPSNTCELNTAWLVL